MMKVIVITRAGEKSDIFPAQTTVREALAALVPDDPCTVIRSGKKILPAEALEECLNRFEDHGIVRLDTVPRMGDRTEVCLEEVPDSAVCTHDVVKQEILKAREALDAAVKALEEDELPF